MPATLMLVPAKVDEAPKQLTWGEVTTVDVSGEPTTPKDPRLAVWLTRERRPDLWVGGGNGSLIYFDVPPVLGPCTFRVDVSNAADVVCAQWPSADYVISPPISAQGPKGEVGPRGEVGPPGPPGEAGINAAQLRADLKWFIGDGVPAGNDGFRVEPVNSGAADDVVIAHGPRDVPAGATSDEIALYFTGRILADGLEATIAADLRFRDQPLNVSQPGAAALAAAWHVPTIPELPTDEPRVTIYLDVWDRPTTPRDDPSAASRTEMEREWAVRWSRDRGGTPPRRGDPDWPAGHGYCALALLQRRGATGDVISRDDLVDLRVMRAKSGDLVGTEVARDIGIALSNMSRCADGSGVCFRMTCLIAGAPRR